MSYGAHGTSIIVWRPTVDDEWRLATQLPASLIQSCQAALDRAGVSAKHALAGRPLGEIGQWEITVNDGLDRQRGEFRTRKVIA